MCEFTVYVAFTILLETFNGFFSRCLDTHKINQVFSIENNAVVKKMKCLKELGEKSAESQADDNAKTDCVNEVIGMECSGVPDSSSSTNSEENEFQESEDRMEIKKSMLNHLSASDNKFFKFLKEDDNDLDRDKKIKIAEKLLHQNYGLFLAKFGNHLLKEHLCYFENRSEEDGLIVDLYLNQLNRAFNKNKSLGQQTSQVSFEL